MRKFSMFAIAALAALAGSHTALAKPAPVRTPAVGAAVKDCSSCPEVIRVPAGSFIMGASIEEERRHGMSEANLGRSMPLRKVTFAKGFAMGKTPVTVAQFRSFIDETKHPTSESCFNQRYNDGHFIYEKARGYNWRSPGFPQDDRHPVVCVSAEDAEAYVKWLSKKTGKRYAIPNEAQYEYALRAGTTTSFFWGDNQDATACLYSNQPDFDQADELKAPRGPEYRFQCSDGYAWTSPVGIYKPNPWGLYDMQGNIWEWTADCWNNDYNGAPTDGSTWTTGDCDARPSRGGSYGNASHSAFAGIRAPRSASYTGHSWGFRVVRLD
ncbi:formylglycine-generating enzyme family protein [Novosphingobium aquae]|uniref:Formylglycine-generating enzyme family protein n=1 Tax=Novosphingobium aquae TaxID=3133435 RepID=A0ABU8SCP5_9SPHN